MTGSSGAAAWAVSSQSPVRLLASICSLVIRNVSYRAGSPSSATTPASSVSSASKSVPSGQLMVTRRSGWSTSANPDAVTRLDRKTRPVTSGYGSAKMSDTTTGSNDPSGMTNTIHLSAGVAPGASGSSS